MKNIRRLCATLLLTLAFAATAFGGDMETPVAPPPPAPAAATTAATPVVETASAPLVDKVTAVALALAVVRVVLSLA